MDEVENVKRFVQNLDEIGGYQDEKGKSMRNLVEEISLDLAPGDSPLHFSSQTSSAAASIDIELRIAEAKERMKQMLQDSHDICRKLSFHADDTDQTDKELKQDMQVNFETSPLCYSSEQNDRDLALIDDSNEEDASVPNLSSKFSSIVQAATQSAGTVPALQKVSLK
ncbi:hypothetical protein AXG93_4003s1360 [Marchantia polymorpha subsp. ruderalis]|uniref:Uncharacterized protein n=1 Tax=Marchantia polymorpha subsp. ruderalis TaxID=1480154 RepID=A0A176WAA6_MARPO|nr:hypothetical protein AXG93_4003s1360 [Marchantia polymorpha subsp. ruderalis]